MDKTSTQNFKTGPTGYISQKLLCGYGREHSFDYGEYRYVHSYLQTASTTTAAISVFVLQTAAFYDFLIFQ